MNDEPKIVEVPMRRQPIRCAYELEREPEQTVLYVEGIRLTVVDHSQAPLELEWSSSGLGHLKLVIRDG